MGRLVLHCLGLNTVQYRNRLVGEAFIEPGESFCIGTVLFSVSLAACGGQGDSQQTELTRAQKDSIVADLPVPGASGVGRAMDTRDRANERAAELDSIGG